MVHTIHVILPKTVWISSNETWTNEEEDLQKKRRMVRELHNSKRGNERTWKEWRNNWTLDLGGSRKTWETVGKAGLGLHTTTALFPS